MYDLTNFRERLASLAAVLLVGLLLSASCAGGVISSLGDANASPDPAAGNPPPVQQNTVQRTGVTFAFGIPAGMEGTVSTGEALYASSCNACHGSMGARTFGQISTARAAIGAMKSLSLSQQEVADITAYLNRASIPPVTDPGTGSGTPPVSNPPADPVPPVTDPGSTPTPPAGDSLSGFGIPTGMSGSISAGEQVWNNSCSACHSSMGARSFTALQSAIAGIGAMRSIQLTEQELADLTAYLNRNAAGGGTGTGTGGGSGGDDDDDDGVDDDGDDDDHFSDDDDDDDDGVDDDGDDEDDDDEREGDDD